MADERTYGFSKPDARSLVNLIGNADHEFPEIRPRGGKSVGKTSTYIIEWTFDAGYCDLGETPELCSDRNSAEKFDTSGGLRVLVSGASCNTTDVYGQDEDGFVTVKDSTAGRFLENRTITELDGISGFATLMTGQAYEGCEWIVTWINWFQERQFVQDWYVRDLDIVEEKANAYVWNWCRLPDEIITGTDCDPDLYLYGE